MIFLAMLSFALTAVHIVIAPKQKLFHVLLFFVSLALYIMALSQCFEISR